MSERKCKTVLCLRNPKDVAVSFFNHFRGLKSYAYDGKWENWLRPYLDGQCKIIVALSARGKTGVLSLRQHMCGSVKIESVSV